MKLRFSTIDILASVAELKVSIIGMRVHQVYDIDNKTYLIRLQRQSDEKSVILIESGVRIHRTDFEWPKNSAPSGFTMKLRKHLKNKRLESLRQLGADRVLDLQFGSGDVANHLIIELYDKGNLVLTDSQFMILNILRPRMAGGQDGGKQVVRERYPVELAQQSRPLPSTCEELAAILNSTSKIGDNLRKVLAPHFSYGPAVTEHILSKAGFSRNCCVGPKGFDLSDCIVSQRLLEALREAECILVEVSSKPNKGYLIQKVVQNKLLGGEEKEVRTLEEFHPYLYEQHRSGAYVEFDSFQSAVDHFFSQLESQRIDSKVAQLEHEALRKLDNVRQDHDRRVEALQERQAGDTRRGQLVESNLDLVEKALLVVRSAIASQIGWESISALVEEARLVGDPVACSIDSLQLDKNHMVMRLKDPYDEADDLKPQLVEIDLDLSAYANARKFYDHKRHALKKEQKTLESSEKAFKNAEKRTKQTLKEAAITSAIVKARKSFWFEKFLWFISSENYLVIGGRDVQQNEMLVKRYLKKNDLYVHADLHGASSIVVKNPSGGEVPPKTLNEAGAMALCYSAAWEAKVVTSAWWVYHHQVSKTAPTGEYLTAGSFMIRGKKNYLPPSHLVVGFGFFFKLDEDSIERHRDERRILRTDEGNISESPPESNQEEEEELVQDVLGDDDDKDDSETEEESLTFPNTVVHHRTQMQGTEESENTHVEEVMEVSVTAPKLTAKQQQKQSRAKEDDDTPPPSSPPTVNKEKSAGTKRGQKSKLRKIREKYGEQDEEERRLRMEILASAGTKKPDKKKGKEQKPARKAKNVQPTKQVRPATAEKEENDDEEEEEEEETPQSKEDESALASLTGCPVPEDTLLFAIPVCAPYAALSNFKFKVKVVPGTGRRGKASRAAVSAFMHDRNATPREKDLLRSVKDQDLSRNLPGKVKIMVAKKH